MSKSYFERFLEDRSERYLTDLALLHLSPKSGVRMTCPSCHRFFWLTLPTKSQFGGAVGTTFACTTACGYFGNLASFSPVHQDSAPEGLDTTSTCNRCEVQFATDGVVVKRPCCGVENPRELMALAMDRIVAALDENSGRHDLELMLGFLVSTFDGLMRSSLQIANDNARYFETNDPDHPLIGAMRALPNSSSFQSLAAARLRLLPTGWDMATRVPDWPALVRLFQKRHTVAHRLGVVDQEYLDKTGDTTSSLGKRVPLTAAEITDGARACHSVIVSFFGNFLS